MGNLNFNLECVRGAHVNYNACGSAQEPVWECRVCGRVKNPERLPKNAFIQDEGIIPVETVKVHVADDRYAEIVDALLFTPTPGCVYVRTTSGRAYRAILCKFDSGMILRPDIQLSEGKLL